MANLITNPPLSQKTQVNNTGPGPRQVLSASENAQAQLTKNLVHHDPDAPFSGSLGEDEEQFANMTREFLRLRAANQESDTTKEDRLLQDLVVKHIQNDPMREQIKYTADLWQRAIAVIGKIIQTKDQPEGGKISKCNLAKVIIQSKTFLDERTAKLAQPRTFKFALQHHRATTSPATDLDISSGEMAEITGYLSIIDDMQLTGHNSHRNEGAIQICDIVTKCAYMTIDHDISVSLDQQDDSAISRMTPSQVIIHGALKTSILQATCEIKPGVAHELVMHDKKDRKWKTNHVPPMEADEYTGLPGRLPRRSTPAATPFTGAPSTAPCGQSRTSRRARSGGSSPGPRRWRHRRPRF
jgi:hypothetical protein